MSVLIKGMKKPKNCSMCQFHGFGGYKNELIVCSLKGRSEGQLSNVPNCPLIEVPTPHGRLIDADRAIAMSISGGEMYHISAAPTIIEAEEGEKDE